MGIFGGIDLWQAGVILALAFTGVVLAVALGRVALIVIACMLLVTGFGISQEAGLTFEYRTFLFPIQLYRSYIYGGLGLLLWVLLVPRAQDIRTCGFSPVVAFLILLGMFMGFVHTIHAPSAGILTVVMAVSALLPMGLILPTLMRTRADWFDVLRYIALAGGAWVVACTVQFLINQDIVLSGAGRRFVGLTGNPQHAAALCAFMLVINVFLAVNEPKKTLRAIWIAVGAAYLVFVGWTGSRTGTLMSMLGLMAVFYARLGTAILLAPILLGMGFALVSFATAIGVRFGFERLVSLEDTRTSVWVSLIQQAMESPLIGRGPAETAFSENSLLLGFSSYGVGALIIMLLIMLSCAVEAVRVWRARRDLEPLDRRFGELSIGLFAMYWAGAMFEGYGAGRVNAQIVFLLLAGALAMRVRKAGQQARLEASMGSAGDPAAGDAYGQYEWYGDPQADPVLQERAT